MLNVLPASSRPPIYQAPPKPEMMEPPHDPQETPRSPEISLNPLGIVLDAPVIDEMEFSWINAIDLESHRQENVHEQDTEGTHGNENNFGDDLDANSDADSDDADDDDNDGNNDDGEDDDEMSHCIMDFRISDEEWDHFQRHADIVFICWVLAYGPNSVYKYMHWWGSGHFSHYGKVLGNLSVFSQQAVESIQGFQTSFAARCTQRWGQVGRNKKTDQRDV